ncbi:Myosin-12 [Phytophthora fragariae]|uniref:Myosin-12 n=5 Tax=Phytophthora fragariae TaxID=53985 RepID=A0A6A3UH08_9STRA|nr:Myosin-12 [Phytophthora fragariae]KAE8942623.1 Myosin-12 [Phytophthora fragariae]KAE9123342.1 Myosin-12 [Phytophthora fragariae]KAE9124068.1 Myosin-12 [Phytophthora fragariae]KAE9149387.1 Myosin-12 [Phytophthora fragariae]
MEVGAPVWVFDRDLWHEAVVAAPVDAASDLVECALEPETDDEHLVTPEGDDVVPDAQEFQPVTPRKRRNSRRNSVRRSVSVPVDLVLPRSQGEHYHTVQDLTKLVHLHEPAILQVLRRRFYHGEIYTSTGQILVAMNPFRRLAMYSDDTKDQYYNLGGNAEADKSALAPHVYSVADQAFRTMLVPRSSDKKTDQTILVSGESGAGKTETTKLIMNYLAYVSTKRTHRPIRASNCDQTTIHDRVLESNPILEAFGNARTTRNNNSSRFGKFIKLGFTSSGEMLGASISTYLLERVRLVSQGKGERNYHVFYEMCGGSSPTEREELALLDIHEYAYLNQSECYERLDGVDDAESYRVTRRAMSSIGMSSDEQLNVMKIVSAVLHLGNLSFTTATRNGGKDDASVVDMDDCGDSIRAICALLGVQEDDLRSTLCTKQIKAGAEFITTRLPVAQALSTRDSVVKTLYSNLFNWLVDRINRSIEYKEEAGGSQFIGVVDIFGFEIFEQNRLEQLCINYANEKLQQLFGRFVFRMEQDQYVAEEIPWKFVDYPNNDVCVALVEKRHMGIFSLLDEQCLIPRGNDEKLANKYYELLAGKHESFSVSKLQRAKGQFVIHHYAGNVCYMTDGFCDKNKDHMHTEAVDLLRTSKFSFVRACFENSVNAGGNSPRNGRTESRGSDSIRRRSGGGIMSSTVVAQFKSQLSSLLDVLNATEPHFIRCIKPNDQASSSQFDRRRLLEQLRCSGVLEAVKISRSGYPVRFPHDVFIKTYSCILSQIPNAQGQAEKEVAAQMVEKLAKVLDVNTDSKHPPFQVGKTKVFCVLEAHQALEAGRSKALYKSVITLQRYCLGYSVRTRYQRKRRSSIRIQAIWRSWSCWNRYQRIIRRERAAVTVQRTTRGFLARKQVRRMRAATIIQSFVRGWLVRREYSANTLSFEHDVSYVGSLDDRSTTESSISLSESISMKDRKNTTISFQSSVTSDQSSGEYMGDDGSISIRSSSRFSRKKMIEEYEPPKQIPNEYEIVWECGLLGLYFESDPVSGMPIVRRVHESLSNCADIFEVSRGDVLLAVGKVKVKKGDIRRILTLLQEVQKPVRLHFLRNPTESFRLRSGSLELLGEEDYEVLWKEGVPLGLGFRPDPSTGYPCVLQSQGNQLLPGMFNVRAGDHLVFINEFSTQGVRFQKVIDILESGPRPAVLRFRHTDLVEDPHQQLDQTISLNSSVLSNPQDDSHSMGMSRLTRPSRVSMNPKNDHSLYYITWKEEDGPLGIVVKQESTSYYPRVINVKSEGAVTRESQKNRVEIGDVLLSINNNNISKMGFGAAMKLLQKGPKPLLLMFQRPRTSLSMTARTL